ncbi:MAG: signal peptidase I [Ignavibacteriales bacterium]|nr:signal peptidase I [Ignavibacteriales bacterium]
MNIDPKGHGTEEAPASSQHGHISFTTVAKIILYSLVVAVVLKAFFVEAYRIPTTSMEQTLLPGDMILVNKTAYHFAGPAQIPFFDTPVKRVVLFRTGQINRFDVVTFLHPGGQEEIVPSQQQYYIKRLVGLPGETLSITNKNVYINGRLLSEGNHVMFKDTVPGEPQSSERIFPKGMEWNRDDYGPIQMPYKGMQVFFTADNFLKYRVIIARETGSSLEWKAGKIYSNGTLINSYTFKDNYYFAMGDNRDDSFDSRYWGPVPESNIYGKASFIYLSFEPFSENFFTSIRWARAFRIIR